MNQRVGPGAIVVALVVLAAIMFGIYRFYGHASPVQHPGADDIPKRIPGHDKPVPPPPDAGPAPGTMKR